MKHFLRGALAVVLLWFMARPAQAQTWNKGWSFFSIAPSIGVANYKGDLDDDFTLKFSRPGLGLSVNFHFHPHMFARIQFQYGWMGANDSVSVDDARAWRNLSFRSHIAEASFQLVYDFFANPKHFRFRPTWSPYIFAGVGVFNFNPQAKPSPEWVSAYPNLFESTDDWVDLQPLRTEAQGLGVEGYPDKPYALTQLSIPMGIGVRYKINDYMDLRAEVGLRKTFTDYLDDVSNIYAPPDVLAAYDFRSFLFADRSGYTGYGLGHIANNPTLPNYNPLRSGYYATQEANEVRGFDTQDDWYVFSNVALFIILDKPDRCPKFK